MRVIRRFWLGLEHVEEVLLARAVGSVFGATRMFSLELESDNLITCRISLLPTRLVTSPIYSTVSNTGASTTPSFVAARQSLISNPYRADGAPMSNRCFADTNPMRRGRRN